MVKLPYGIGNFEDLHTEGYYYVDRTQYIEVLENLPQKYLFMLRPRRFGKSLFVSMLEHYYDVYKKESFQELFGDLYIGQKPTKKANSYLILKFNFSGIDTSSPENAHQDFTDKVRQNIKDFLLKYQRRTDTDSLMGLKKSNSPHACLNQLLSWYKTQGFDAQIYLLIDEYDHFANEILSFNLHRFQGMVGQNGWVRKFYETIKIGTEEGIFDRIYITGVSPLTLDSMTSGFNIGTNLSTDSSFNEMLGFTKIEVRQIMKGIDIMEGAMEQVMADMKQWYNGYRFSEEAEQQIYNPNMVLHFATYYARKEKYPKQLLDTNVASDYGKISRLFGVGDRTENEKTLEILLKEGAVTAQLTQQFNLADQFTPPDLISLLYYNGIVTIDNSEDYLSALRFKMPNFVIQQLYYKYFYRLLIEKVNLSKASIRLDTKMIALAQHNDPQPLLAHIEDILGKLSTRDKPRLDEKHLKMIFTALFHQIGYYTILSEKEVSLPDNKKGFVDLLLLARSPFKPRNQFIFELKYLAKAQKKRLETVTNAAKEQLNTYLKTPEIIAMGKLRAYTIIFVGSKAHVSEINA